MMRRLCERPGCSQLAEVVYGMSTDGPTVWLESLGEGDPARSGVLCRRHADAMVVPRGWTLDDRRESVPRLFRTPEAPTAPPSAPSPTSDSTPLVGTAPATSGGEFARPRRKGRRTSDETGQLDLTSLLDAGSAEPTDADATDPAVIVEPLPGLPAVESVAESHLAEVPETDRPDDDAEVVLAAEVVDDGPVAPWRPVFDQRSDLDGLLDVRSPLLSRAFRGRGPRSEG